MSDELIRELEALVGRVPHPHANSLFVSGIQHAHQQVEAVLNAEKARRKTFAPHDNQWITIPRPHVAHGPKGEIPEASDYRYLQDAAKTIENRKMFGSNVTRTIVTLISDAAEAVKALPTSEPPWAGAIVELDNGEKWVRMWSEGMEGNEEGDLLTEPWMELNGPDQAVAWQEISHRVVRVHFWGFDQSRETT